MKKFLSLMMTMAMVFSLAMPAAAVAVSGPYSKNVTASYTPTTPEPTKYTVTVNSAENGSVTANPTSAAEGETVTLTIDPDDGYQLASLSVQDDSGADVEVDSTAYTFEMPAANVTVTAAFEVEEDPAYNVEIDAGIEHGTVTTNLTQAAAGTPIVLTITPDIGYELESLSVNGEVVTAGVVDGRYTFPMGTEDVAVSAVFAAVRYTITVEDTENGTVSAPEAAVYGETVTLIVDAAAQYELESLEVTDAEGNPVSVSDKQFTMPASNVIVTAVFEKRSISSAEISWGAMEFTYDDTVDEATGEEKGWTDNGTGWVKVTNTGATTVTASAKYNSEADYTEITGSFSIDSETLDSEESVDFTLTLTGKPDAAIPAGTKIGTVTVEITSVPEA